MRDTGGGGKQGEAHTQRGRGVGWLGEGLWEVMTGRGSEQDVK